MQPAQQLRRLGLHERYCVARHNVGAPVVLAFAASFKPRSATDVDGPQRLQAHLLSRVSSAIDTLPLLNCFVHGARTREPHFATLGKVCPEDVLRAPKHLDGPLDLDAKFDSEFNDIDASVGDIGTAPLWKVETLVASNGEYAAVLVIHHVVADGRGSANLFEHLLSEGPTSDSRAPVAASATAIPETSDELIRPSLTFSLRKVWSELIVPRLPAFVRTWVEEAPFWPRSLDAVSWQDPSPDAQQGVTALTGRKNGRALMFKRGTIVSLKRLAVANGVKTVHPLLHSAAIVATAACARAGTAKADEPLPVASATPMSLRSRENVKTQSRCTGNFVGSMSWDSMLDVQGSFWAMTRAYADHITSEATRRTGRFNIGVLAYLPDSASYEAERECTPTQWEAWLYENANKTPPVMKESFEMSNVGRICVPSPTGPESVLWSLDRVAWRQRPAIFGYPFCVDVAGLDTPASPLGAIDAQTDLVMSVGWTEGAVPMLPGDQAVAGDTTATRFWRALEACIEVMVELGESSDTGVDAIGESLALQDVVAMVRRRLKGAEDGGTESSAV
ncbi:unnamed protein product [Parajaminaea phylloscopi]